MKARISKSPDKSRLGLRAVSLLDQVLFSAANFILTLVLVKYYSDVEVVGYGIGLSIALIIQSTQRSCYVVQNSILSPGVFRNRAAKVLGQHLVIWAFILAAEALISVVVLWAYPGSYSVAIVVSTFVCSLIYAQLDFDRVALIKHDKIVDPFLASAAFFLMNVILFFAIPHWHIGYLTTMALVGLYAALKIARLVVLIGRPDFFWGWRLARSDFRKYFAGALLGTAGYSGYNHIPLFILGHVAPPVHSAAFVAMRGLVQPLLVILRSLDVMDKNIFQARAGRSHSALRSALFRQLAAYGALSALAVAGVALLGEPVIRFVYGARYEGFANILTGWALIATLYALTLPLETVIVKLGRLPQFYAWRMGAGIIGVVFATVLSGPIGAVGAIFACLAGWVVSIGCAFWVIRDVLQEHRVS